MRFLESNEQALQKYRREFHKIVSERAEQLEKELADKGYRDGVIQGLSMVPTKEGISALVVETKEKKFRLNSAFCPFAEAQKWAQQYEEIKEHAVVVLFGMGNGVFAREIYHKLPKTAHMIIVEPSLWLFSYAMENFDFSDFIADDRVIFSIEGATAHFLLRALEKYIYFTNVSLQLIIMHPEYQKIFPQEALDCGRIVKENSERVLVNKNTRMVFGKRIVENTLDNLDMALEANSIHDLKNIISKDMPVIIVAAGPSLDKNIEDLRAAQGKALIIATDTAFKYMIKKNMEPDLLITIDPQKTPKHFETGEYAQIPMLTKIEANPQILRPHRAKKYLFNCQSFIKEMFADCGITIPELGGGGSVATAAFAVCVELGMKRIILIGQDLAYAGEKTHAGNVISIGVNQQDEGTLETEDIYGNLIRTRMDWYAYLKWYQNSIQEIARVGADIEVIDATEGGAKIRGTRLMTLKEAIAVYCTKPYEIAGQLREMLPDIQEEKKIIFQNYLQDAIRDVEEMISLSKKGIDLCIELKQTCQMQIIDSYVFGQKRQELQELHKRIEKKQIFLLLDDYMAGDTTEQLMDIYQSKDGSGNNQNYYEKTEIVYQALQNAATEVLPRLREQYKVMFERGDRK